jgi:hypothetical protein
MTLKRTILAFVTVFVLASLANFLIHAILLAGAYQQNPGLLREARDGQAHAPFLLVAFFFFALAFVWMYPQAAAGGSWLGQGVRYGVAVWLIASVSRYFIYYAIQPWPFSTVLLQLLYELGMMLILGGVLALLARPQAGG